MMSTQFQWEDNGRQAIFKTAGKMIKHKFSGFTLRGADFFASTTDNSIIEPHIGQLRVRFRYNKCGPATVIAQQIKDEEQQYTLRNWHLNTKLSYFKNDIESNTKEGSKVCSILSDSILWIEAKTDTSINIVHERKCTIEQCEEMVKANFDLSLI